VDDLSHGPVPRGTLGRLRLGDDPVSGLEGHGFSFHWLPDRAYSSEKRQRGQA
jgi:hypothetical protein